MRPIFDSGTLSSSIFVAGVGRSGTTWVGDVINARNTYRVIFEPFYPQKVSVARHFRYRQYLPPWNCDENYVGVASAIMTGRIRNAWIDKYNKCIFANKRLIKDIRANLLLKWLNVNFPQVRYVLLIRHPCAVACSKLQYGWGTHLEEFLDQPQLMKEHLDPFRDILESAKDDFERHICAWCVENYVPLRQFEPGELYVAFYEELCTNPDKEYRKLFAFVGSALTKSHIQAFKRPSAMVGRASAIRAGTDIVTSWRKVISPEQIIRALEIVSAFGLTHLYGHGALPVVNSGILERHLAPRFQSLTA